MSEYIIDATDHVIGEGFDARAFFGPRLKEEIVRCRDCKWWAPYQNECQGYCSRFSFVAHVDSFCSWGERRDA